MTIKVIRHELTFDRIQVIPLHEDADVLCVKVGDDGEPCLYALVNSDAEEYNTIEIRLYRENAPMDIEFADHMRYISTIDDYKGIAHHVFYRWR